MARYEYSNVGLDNSMAGVLAQECQPSTVPRPTGMCQRFAINVPPTQPYINPDTGVRRKTMCPKMEFDEGYTDYTDIDTEVEDDFSQAEEDCREEIYGGMPGSLMPWANRYNSPGQAMNRLENLIREETEEIEQSQRYMRHADVRSLPRQRRFWELSAQHRNKSKATGGPMDTDNLDPDVAAAMMSTEEQGQVLKHIPPAALFNRLFPEDNRKCTLLIKGASKYHRDHVVPERGALLQDCLMSDVDAGILPFADLVDPRADETLPEPLFHPDKACPDGICESSKKVKVQKLKATNVDDDGVELTWAAPKEGVKGFQVYYAPSSPDDRKSKEPLHWESVYVSTPRYDAKWNSVDPKAEALHFAVSPIVGDSQPPETPTKDTAKVEVKKPKTRSKSPPRHKELKTMIDNVQVRNVPGGIEVDWDTPPHAKEGALVEFKSDTHTKMQYKAARENQVFLPVPEKQGRVYIALQPRTSGPEPPPVVELFWDIKQSKITELRVSEKEEEDSKRHYTVSSLPPLTGNFIQLRGSVPPPWFPGYYTVQPGVGSVVPLDQPQEALEKAWASMGPAQIASPHGNFLLGKP